jgi:hypothetical protein
VKNIIGKVSFVAAVVAYIAFMVDDSRAIGLHDYRTHAIAIPLLGILGHLAFQHRAERR